MATKAALAASLLVALVAMAAATSYTTTVITNSIDDDDTNPRQQQCRQHMQGRHFRSCQRYFQQSSGAAPFEEEQVLEMSTGVEHHQQFLQECCQQLKEMDRQQCGCEAIKQAVKEAQEEGGSRRHSYETGQSERIYQKARSLPRMCGLSQQQCRFGLVLV